MDVSLRNQISAALEALGGTADEVADSLRARGITGYLFSANSCPIANYLKVAVPDSVGEVAGVLSWGVFDTADDTHQPVVLNPTAVKDFILHFDRTREYDDLNARHPRLAALA